MTRMIWVACLVATLSFGCGKKKASSSAAASASKRPSPRRPSRRPAAPLAGLFVPPPTGPSARGAMAPGNMAPGNMAPGNMAPGNMAPGSMAPGNMAPGNMAPGSMAPGGQRPPRGAAVAPALPSSGPALPPVPDASLEAELREKARKFKEKAPKKLQDIMRASRDKLAAGTLLTKAVNVDAIAPDFTLPDALGKSIQLRTLLKKGPVVLTWYRGGWCPYCNITLRHYAKWTAKFKAAGATLVVVSPDTPDKSLSTAEKLKLPMVVLSDVGLKVARKYGLVYRLSAPLKKVYDKKFQLKSWSGSDAGDLPLTAAYVIGQDGRIRYAFIDPDYRHRADPGELLAAVEVRTGARVGPAVNVGPAAKNKAPANAAAPAKGGPPPGDTTAPPKLYPPPAGSPPGTPGTPLPPMEPSSASPPSHAAP